MNIDWVPRTFTDRAQQERWNDLGAKTIEVIVLRMQVMRKNSAQRKVGALPAPSKSRLVAEKRERRRYLRILQDFERAIR